MNKKGFTLIEILVTLALIGLIMSAVYSVYIANIKAAVVEEQRVDLQQGQRFAVDLLSSQLRMAGYDLAESGEPTILDARNNFIYFTADMNDDGDVNDDDTAVAPEQDDDGEHIAFCTYVDGDGNLTLGFTIGDGRDTDGNGIPDVGEIDGGHNHGSLTHQPVVAIEGLEFYYTLSDGTRKTDPLPNEFDSIRSVEVSLLVKTDWQNPQYRNSAQVFQPASNTATGNQWVVAANDGFMRRLVISNVRLRNMGL